MAPLAQSVPPPGHAPAAATSHDLRTLVLSRHAAIALETPEEGRADELIHAVARDLDLPILEWTVTRGLVNLVTGGAAYETNDLRKAMAHAAELKAEILFVFKDLAGHLTDPSLSRQFRELLARFAQPHRLSTVILVGATMELPPEVEPHVVHYEMRPPTHEEYRRTVMAVADSLAADGRARIEVTPEDIEAMARTLGGMTLNQARQAIARIAIHDGRLWSGDLPSLIELKAAALRDDALLEYFPPGDNPTELGGFGSLRRWLDRARLASTPEAEALNLPRPRGVLLVGVQGCGKSLAAKYVARSWQLPLLKLDAGRLYDKYVGETERNLRRAISTAESLAPVVLWLDEIEKALAPSGGDDGGVSRRMFGSFLTWLQEKTAEVFVVATANDLSILPPELLRKGRFDEIFFVDLPDAAERTEILRIHLALRKQDPGAFDLAALAAACDGFSGAEIEQVVISALLQSLHERRPLDGALLSAEMGATVPLSRARAEDVQRLRDYARGRFIPVR